MVLATPIAVITNFAHTVKHKPSGVNPWAVIVAASVIIGIVGGIIAILTLVNYYKQRRVDRGNNRICKVERRSEERKKKQGRDRAGTAAA